MGESIERQVAVIRNRLAFLKMIERVLATNAPAAAEERILQSRMRHEIQILQ